MAGAGRSAYKTRSPVLFVIFNRPDLTRKVFGAIREAAPARVYVAADGPRNDNPEDAILCAETREILEEIDWNCEVKTLYRDENIGCKYGVSAAIDWFFENEAEGIILEDDCLPSNSFFRFCDEMLEMYRHDDRVRHITGCNLQFKKKWGEASYYFSNRVHVWGWAGWKTAWNDYDITLNSYSPEQIKARIKDIYGDELVAEIWTNIFTGQKGSEINSWAYPLDFSVFLNGGLVVIPNKNLISNIGFNKSATNTLAAESVYANIPLDEMEEPIIHPDEMVPQKQADLCIMHRDFDIEKHRRKYNKWHRRIRRWIKNR